MDFINPLEILNQIDIEKTATVADLGSGSGGWAIPLAKKVNEGKVFAVDIQDEPLSALLSRAKMEGVNNIKTIAADAEKEIAGISGLSCDFVLLANILFQVEDKKAVIREAKRILKPEGLVLVVDWKVGSPLGPRQGKVSAEEIKEIAREEGFSLEKEMPAGAYHYVLLFSKK